MQRLFEEKVTDEEAVRDTFVQSIDENKVKVTEAARRLGDSAPNLATDDDGTMVRSVPPSPLVTAEQQSLGYASAAAVPCRARSARA